MDEAARRGHEDRSCVRQTAKVWEADLGEAGRRLTLAELHALEAMHLCDLLSRIAVAVEGARRHLSSLEGRVDRVEQFLGRVDPRYPRSPEGPPMTALPRWGPPDDD